jgi:beta-lactamase superfamily II metal-dependent hydrolase
LISDSPEEFTLEVIVIGIGFGESVLVKYDHQSWMIIDSCVMPGQTEPEPVTYLRSLNVDVASEVRYIVATHWHDDHVRGLSRLVDICKSANFVCSTALVQKEFLTLAYAYRALTHTSMGSGVDELIRTMEIIKNRGSMIKRVKNDNRIYANEREDVSIWALSPSDKQFDRFLTEILTAIPTKNETMRRATSAKPNSTSVVIQVLCRGISILLGADLEEPGDIGLGWSAITNSTGRPKGRSCFFKVPHHGSINGHHEEVWSHMLEPDPISVITTYQRGSNKLPRQSDLDRIILLTDKLYLAGDLARLKLGRVDRSLEKAVRDLRIEVMGWVGKLGIVHTKILTCSLSSSSTECKGAALATIRAP